MVLLLKVVIGLGAITTLGSAIAFNSVFVFDNPQFGLLIDVKRLALGVISPIPQEQMLHFL